MKDLFPDKKFKYIKINGVDYISQDLFEELINKSKRTIFSLGNSLKDLQKAYDILIIENNRLRSALESAGKLCNSLSKEKNNLREENKELKMLNTKLNKTLKLYSNGEYHLDLNKGYDKAKAGLKKIDNLWRDLDKAGRKVNKRLNQ